MANHVCRVAGLFVVALALPGALQAITDDQRHYSGLSASAHLSKIAFVAQGPTGAVDLHRSTVERFAASRLTDPNSQVANESARTAADNGRN